MSNPDSDLIDWLKISSEGILTEEFIDTFSDKLVFWKVTEERNSSPSDQYLDGLLDNYDIGNNISLSKNTKLLEFFVQYYDYIVRDYEDQSYSGDHENMLNDFIKFKFSPWISTHMKFKPEYIPELEPYLASGINAEPLATFLTDDFMLFCKLKGLSCKYFKFDVYNEYQKYKDYMEGKNG